MPGHYKIFLGMAAGVGKTYRMLAEAQAEAEAGRDVVIGLLETHGRAETEALADGLEAIPRRRVPYRGVSLEEMDLPGILRRAPELCLIDELAHTNAPGLDHPEALRGHRRRAGGRHRRVLDRQRPAPRVAQRSGGRADGVRVRETVPDDELSKADEVVLIDLPPEDLVTRLRDGKVYDAARVPAALNGFFRVENLRALREVALRQVAENVEARRLDARDPADRRAPARVRRRSTTRTSASCAAPRARPSGSAGNSTCSWSATRSPRPPRPSASGSRRCAGSSRCSAPTC